MHHFCLLMRNAYLRVRLSTSLLLTAGVLAVACSALPPARGQWTVPYATDFEPPTYVAGPLHGQNSWVTLDGSAVIEGTGGVFLPQQIILQPGASPAIIGVPIAEPATTAPVMYLDFLMKPAVTPDIGSLVTTDSAFFLFMLYGSQGQLWLQDGSWRPTPVSIAVMPDHSAAEWCRVTLRFDFVGKKWDLYFNNALVAYDVAFSDPSQTRLARVLFRGHAVVPTNIDYFKIDSQNPIFTDANNNGIADSWETTYGLPLAAANRGDDPDSDGLTNVREYQLGTHPNKVDTDDDGLTDSEEISYGTDPKKAHSDSDTYSDGLEIALGMDPHSASATAFPLANLRLLLHAGGGVVKAGSNVTAWRDQSGALREAIQSTTTLQPAYVPSVVNGRPVLRFDGIDDMLALPVLFTGTAAAEVFVVWKAAVTEPHGVDRENGMWTWGTDIQADRYPDGYGRVLDSFGRSRRPSSGIPLQRLDEFHLYNASSQSGSWSNRVSHRPLFAEAGYQVAWSNAPLLGKSLGQHGSPSYCFRGDIAEMLVFAGVLTATERLEVARYLSQKYQLAGSAPPGAPTNVVATTVSSSQISVAWTAPRDPTDVSYAVERQLGGGPFVAVAEIPGALGYLDTNLEPGVQYTYRVQARNWAGTSLYSDLAHATTNPDWSSLPSGMQLWLTADSGNFGVGPVTQWTDQSGNNNHASSPADQANRPSVLPNRLNGRPTIQFDGTDDMFTLPNFMYGRPAGEIFVVLKADLFAPDGSRRENGIWSLGSDSWATADRYPSGDGGIYDTFGRSTRLSAGVPAQPLNEFHLYNVTAKAGEWSNRINGRLLASAVQNSASWSAAPKIGYSQGAGSPSYYFAGEIAELLLYTTELTTAERARVHEYLTRKYSLPAIPVPAVPRDVIATAVSDDEIAVAWTGSGESLQVEYTLERRNSGGTFVEIAQLAGVVGYRDTGLSQGTTYEYRVRARTYAGPSDYSDPASATTLSNESGLPTDGIRLWLRADAGNDGPGAVNQWRDQSGAGRVASQADPAKRPRVIAGALNGFPVIRFDGIDDALDLGNLMSGVQAAEIFVVWRANVTDANGQLRENGMWTWGTDPKADRYPSGMHGVFDSFGRSDRLVCGAPHQSLDRFHLYGVTANQSEWSNRINGRELFSTVGATPVWTTEIRLGWSRGSFFSYAFRGDIAEVILYQESLSPAERDAVGRYLSRKYALPIDQPTGLRANRTSTGTVELSWHLSGTSARYHIERRDGANAFVRIGTTEAGATFTDLAAPADAVVEYRVQGESFGLQSQYSAIASVVSPTQGDANDDGIPDYIAVLLGLDYTSGDVDGDGLSNTSERIAGTDPLHADSDRDGVSDSSDHYPTDPTRSQRPAVDPADQTGPIVTLQRPVQAILN